MNNNNEKQPFSADELTLLESIEILGGKQDTNSGSQEDEDTNGIFCMQYKCS